jgi:hypothetical protein
MMITVSKIADRLTGSVEPRTVLVPWLDSINID